MPSPRSCRRTAISARIALNAPDKGHWLNKTRLTVYSRGMLVAYALIGVGILVNSSLVTPGGFALDSDFGIFQAAARLALEGHPLLVYDPVQLWEKFKSLTGSSGAGMGNFAWFYPPPFLALLLPFGLMPYFPAYLTFMAITLAAYITVLQRIVPGRDALWCLLAFSGVWFNFRLGQNGLLTAALAGAALLNLERGNEKWAGTFIGLLIIKPHLALLFPVALAALGAWRVFWIAGGVALAVFSLSTALLGTAMLAPWWHSLGYATSLTEHLMGYWVNMPTVFAFLRLLGTPVSIAYGIHFLVAALAAATVWQVWRRCPSWPLRNATLVVATFLVSPYLFEYDLAWLALPVAWMTQLGLSEGWHRGERELLIAAWLLPFALHVVARGFPLHLQIGPWVLMALLWIIVHRSRGLAESKAKI